MKALYFVAHEIMWKGDHTWDEVTAHVVASNADQAVEKHRKFISKWEVDDVDEDDNPTGKKTKVTEIRLAEVRQINSIDL